MTTLSGKKNLGPKIIETLQSIGIKNLEDIKDIGPATIYKKLQNSYPDKTFPICYYLYSLEGALCNTYWNDLSEERKMILLQEIGRK